MENSDLEDISKLRITLENASCPIVTKLNKIRKCKDACETALRVIERLQKNVIESLSYCRQRRSMIMERMAIIQNKNTGLQFRVGSVFDVLTKFDYFQDRNRFRPPLNEDEKALRHLRLPDFTQIHRVQMWSKEQKRQILESILKQCRVMLSKPEDEMIEPDALLKAVEPLDSFDDPYDWDRVASECIGTHNANECRAIWRLFIHPSINKNPWTAGEVHRLRTIVESCPQDWDNIALNLNTGRSAYQCFVYFKMFMYRNISKGVKWSSQEDIYLFNLVENCRIGNHISWSKVSYHMKNRTIGQIYNRWLYLFKYYNKVSFSREEINVVQKAVLVYGKKFNKIAKFLPGRTNIEVSRCYYSSLANYSINWKFEEDIRLLNLMANKKYKVNEISKFFPCRSLISIKKRYNFLIRWKKMHPEDNIILIPRETEEWVSKQEATTYLTRALKRLYESYENPKALKKRNRTNAKSFKAIDIELIRYFQHYDHQKLKMDNTLCVSTPTVNACNLKSILFLFHAKLDVDLLSSIDSQNLNTYFKNIINTLLFPNPIQPVQPGLRTYSRKNKSVSTNATKMQVDFKDITLTDSLNKSIIYYFPPSYNIVNGLRMLTLLKYFHNYCVGQRLTYDTSTESFNKLISVFVSRFETLFRWALLLSDILPSKQLTSIDKDENTSIFIDNDIPQHFLHSMVTPFSLSDKLSKVESAGPSKCIASERKIEDKKQHNNDKTKIDQSQKRLSSNDLQHKNCKRQKLDPKSNK